MKKIQQLLLPVLILFAASTAFIFTGSNFLGQKGIDTKTLLWGNIFFMLITVVNFFIQLKAIKNKNPQVFVRSVMASMMIKMLAVIALLAVYWMVSGDKFSKPTVFAGLVLYMIYFILGTTSVMKLNRQKNA